MPQLSRHMHLDTATHHHTFTGLCEECWTQGLRERADEYALQHLTQERQHDACALCEGGSEHL
eukprot:12210063-Prorocentrum_lima.AAC.1